MLFCQLLILGPTATTTKKHKYINKWHVSQIFNDFKNEKLNKKSLPIDQLCLQDLRSQNRHGIQLVPIKKFVLSKLFLSFVFDLFIYRQSHRSHITFMTSFALKKSKFLNKLLSNRFGWHYSLTRSPFRPSKPLSPIGPGGPGGPITCNWNEK